MRTLLFLLALNASCLLLAQENEPGPNGQSSVNQEEGFYKKATFSVPAKDRNEVLVTYSAGNLRKEISALRDGTVGVRVPGVASLKLLEQNERCLFELLIPEEAKNYRFEIKLEDGVYSIGPGEAEDSFSKTTPEEENFSDPPRGEEEKSFSEEIPSEEEKSFSEETPGKEETSFSEETPDKSSSAEPWEDFYLSRPGPASLQTKRKIMEASVRILAPGGKGTGTIIEPPASYRELLKEGEVIIASAGHVVPEYMEDCEITVEVFDYDQYLRPQNPTAFPARLLASTGSADVGDVCILACNLGERAESISPRPVAEYDHWLSTELDYLRVGCPRGENPRMEVTRAIQGQRTFVDTAPGVVTISVLSYPGDSGGGLFDSRGVLMAICSSTTGERVEVLPGWGLLPFMRKFRQQTVVEHLSFFPHAHAARLLFLEAEGKAIENERWVSLQLPKKTDYGLSEKSEQAFLELERQIEDLTEHLGDEGEEVKTQFRRALDALEEANKK